MPFDMGEPVKLLLWPVISFVCLDIYLLSRYIPDVGIELKFTGLRSGGEAFMRKC